MLKLHRVSMAWICCMTLQWVALKLPIKMCQHRVAVSMKDWIEIIHGNLCMRNWPPRSWPATMVNPFPSNYKSIWINWKGSTWATSERCRIPNMRKKFEMKLKTRRRKKSNCSNEKNNWNHKLKIWSTIPWIYSNQDWTSWASRPKHHQSSLKRPKGLFVNTMNCNGIKRPWRMKSNSWNTSKKKWFKAKRKKCLNIYSSKVYPFQRPRKKSKLPSKIPLPICSIPRTK